MEFTIAIRPGALRPERAAPAGIPPALHTVGATGRVGRSAAPAADADCWRTLLAHVPLTPAEVEALTAIAVGREVHQGEAAFTRADCATALIALVEGVVALGLRTADGTLRTERIVRAPAWLDLSSAWLDEPHAVDARATTPARVVELPLDALQALLARVPNLGLGFIRSLAAEVQALATNTHELMHKDAPGRLAQWLMLRSEPAADCDCERIVRLAERKRDVASQLAITPETLSRLMRSFVQQGVIEVAGYTVKVRNPAALAQLAQV